MEVVLPLFFLIFAAGLGGLSARLVKLPPFLGYIVAGLVFGLVVPPGARSIARLAEIGTVFLLFSIGLELSLTRIAKFFKIAVFGSVLQIITVIAVGFFALVAIGFAPLAALILAAGFSLSSTALVLKILGDKGELESLHGGVMTGWLLVQDLAVVPLMVIIPLLETGGGLGQVLVLSLLKAMVVISLVIVAGRSFVPFIIHRIALANSRELLVISSVALALGVASLTSLLGISPALGAFLAGVAISETQEHHAVFAEVRPLRDLFVALFFVSLGFLVDPRVLFSQFWFIFLLVLGVVILKILTVFTASLIFGLRGRSALVTSFGLSQVGEFALVIYSSSLALGKLTPRDASLGMATVLATLLASPFLLKLATPLWRKLKGVSVIFSAGQKSLFPERRLANHIIICGFGRVGSWVGKALAEFKVPYVVVEYDERIASRLRQKGVAVVYGDPAETEIMEFVDLRSAKALVLAIPDIVAQENLIAYAQTIAPQVKIISRVHGEEDVARLKALRVDKLVQPEFEAAIAIVKEILSSMGKEKSEIAEVVRKMRISHAKN